MSANVSQNTTNIQQPVQQQQTTNSDSFITSLQNQLKELENKFSQQLSELRERLNPATKSTARDKMQTEPANNTTTNTTANTKPLNYSVVYSSLSTYKDGKRDLKEHVEVKNPEMNLIADRLPGKEEFEVKLQKEGDKEPTTQTVPVHQLKQEIDRVYSDIQHGTRDDFSRLGLPFGRTAGSLFGSRDLPMLGGNTSTLAIEPEGSRRLFESGSDDRSLAIRPAGTDFFVDEIRNIEREMEFMRRRMEDEMRRFFDF